MQTKYIFHTIITRLSLMLIPLIFLLVGCETKEETYQRAPFEGLDTICTNDWWNRGTNPIIDVNVQRDSVIAFAMYTLDKGIMKLATQMYPLMPEESRTLKLECKINNSWTEVATDSIAEIGWSAIFRIEDWNYAYDVAYRISHTSGAEYRGTIRKDPVEKPEINMAALSCNSNKDRGMRTNIVNNINHIDPDIIFFAGDQSYDHKEHTAAWLLFGKQFKETFRHRPMVSIPDDHDIGQGNLWGENGKKAERIQGDDGGYYYHPAYIRMVERCQTSHLPDPFDGENVEQGIGVYFTNLNIGGVDFAIIEDRKFKSGPKDKIPQQGPRPDHIRNPDYDPKTVDVEGLTLLGERQLRFLTEWANNTDVLMKAVLSQTGFCGAAHIHGQLDNRLHADMDSNGWPQSGRKRALQIIRQANAIHIAGDQHLATVVQHGIDDYRDGPWAFVVPAIVNNYYSRWWWPIDEKNGRNPNNATTLPYTGDYLDGFDNKISMMAYANPDSPDNGAGFGIIRFEKNKNQVTFECWPRYEDVTSNNASQFEGWPITVQL